MKESKHAQQTRAQETERITVFDLSSEGKRKRHRIRKKYINSRKCANSLPG